LLSKSIFPQDAPSGLLISFSRTPLMLVRWLWYFRRPPLILWQGVHRPRIPFFFPDRSLDDSAARVSCMKISQPFLVPGLTTFLLGFPCRSISLSPPSFALLSKKPAHQATKGVAGVLILYSPDAAVPTRKPFLPPRPLPYTEHLAVGVPKGPPLPSHVFTFPGPSSYSS